MVDLKTPLVHLTLTPILSVLTLPATIATLQTGLAQVADRGLIPVSMTVISGM